MNMSKELVENNIKKNAKPKITLLTPDKIKIVGIFSKKSSEKIVVLCHGITSNKNEGGIFIDLEKKLK